MGITVRNLGKGASDGCRDCCTDARLSSSAIVQVEGYPVSSSLFKVTGLPRWYSGKESACQCRRRKRCRFSPCVRKIP